MSRFSITCAIAIALTSATIARADEPPVDPVSIELSLSGRRPYPMRRPRYHEASLVRFLRHADATIRRNALRDIVHNFDVQEPDTHAAISALLEDHDPEVRRAAAEALGISQAAPIDERPEAIDPSAAEETAPGTIPVRYVRDHPSVPEDGAEARAVISGMLDSIRSGCIDFAVNTALVRFEALYRAENYPEAAKSLKSAAEAQAHCTVPKDDAARTRLMSYQGKIQSRLAGIRGSWQDEKVDELLRVMSERAAAADYPEADRTIFRIERYQSMMSALSERLRAVRSAKIDPRVESALRETRDTAADGDLAAVERILSKIERYQQLMTERESRLTALRSLGEDEVITAKLADAEQAAFEGRAGDMDRILSSLDFYTKTVEPRSDRIAAARSGWRDPRVDRLLEDVEQAALRGEGGAADTALARIAFYVGLMGPANERVSRIRSGYLDERVDAILARAAELAAHGEAEEAERSLSEAESYVALRLQLAAALEREASDPIEAKLIKRLEERIARNDQNGAARELANLQKHRETRDQIKSRLADLKSADQDAFRANWIMVCEKSLEEGNLAGANKALAMVDDRA